MHNYYNRRGVSGFCLKSSLREDPISLRVPGGLEEGFQLGLVERWISSPSETATLLLMGESHQGLRAGDTP